MASNVLAFAAMMWGVSAGAACPPSPVVRVDMATPGMAAEEAEKQVLDPMLRHLKGLAGVMHLNGSATDGRVDAEIGFGGPATGAELARVRSALEALRLPVTAQAARVRLEPPTDPDCPTRHDR